MFCLEDNNWLKDRFTFYFKSVLKEKSGACMYIETIFIHIVLPIKMIGGQNPQSLLVKK